MFERSPLNVGRTGPGTRLVKSNRQGAVVGMGVLLALVVLLVFGQVLRHEFIDYDDGLYFFSNPQVQGGLTWNGLAWAFQTAHASNWHPLTWLSLMLDEEVFGPGPMGPHLTNVLLHAANTVLLFLLLQRMTGAYGRSALVAALFGLHPLHVESVAWISERKDALSGLFFLLTLLIYVRYVEKAAARSPQSKVLYGLTLLSFALGLMSKPMLVTLPGVLLLLDYWPIQRFSHATLPRLLLEKLPFLILSVASAAVTLMAQQEAVQPLARISLGIRLVNAIVCCVRYLYKMFWPVNLAIPYPYSGYWPFDVFCLSVVLIAAASVMMVWLGRKFPFLVTGWLWYLGMLVPVIGVVQVGTQSMADRYTYLPLIGIFILLVWGAAEIFGGWRLPLAANGVGAMLLLAACTARTWDQLQCWKSSETLFRHAAAVTKGNYTAYYNLGEFYFNKGRLDEAIDNYRKAIQIRPHYDDALNNLGVALAEKGEFDEAITRIREAIRYHPDKADAYYNLGNVFAMEHKLDNAVGAYTDALRLKPDYPAAHNNLANVLLTQGHREAAIQHYREALRLDPGHEGAKRQLRALGEQIP